VIHPRLSDILFSFGQYQCPPPVRSATSIDLARRVVGVFSRPTSSFSRRSEIPMDGRHHAPCSCRRTALSPPPATDSFPYTLFFCRRVTDSKTAPPSWALLDSSGPFFSSLSFAFLVFSRRLGDTQTFSRAILEPISRQSNSTIFLSD